MLRSSLVEGQIVGGDFRIVGVLGQGGMGAVYLAEQLSTGARRALKVMQPALIANEDLRARFAQEARIGALIQSDHVVQVLAAGVDGNTGIPWLAMELLDGMELCTRVEQHGALSRADAAQVFAQLCHALGAAHERGIVHRDLKPENVFLAVPRAHGATFSVKILDFGIAKILDLAGSRSTQAMGSYLWMAPEQTEVSAAVGPHTDVWALGLIAFYTLVGRSFWSYAQAPDAGTGQLLREILFEPLVPASERARQFGLGHLLPPGFDDWFGNCVVRDVRMRFQHASAAYNALGRVLEAARHSGVPARAAWEAATQLPPTMAATNAWAPSQMGATHAPGQGSGRSIPPTLGFSAVPQFDTPPPQHYSQPPGYTAPAAYETEPRGMRQSSPTGAPSAVTNPPAPPVTRPRKKGPTGAIVVGLGALLLVTLGGIGYGVAQHRAAASRLEDCTKAASSFEANAEALEACKLACEAQGTPYCRHWGMLQARANEDPRPALTLACDASDEAACQPLRLARERKQEDPKAVAAYLGAQCDKGRAASCTLAGDVHDLRSDGNHADRAYELYRKGCEGGDPLGCANLGVMLYAGRRVKQNPESAAGFFDKAAKAIGKHCESAAGLECVAAGWMRETGLGFERDPLAATAAYGKACDAGVAAACSNLGMLYALGGGVNPDRTKATQLFQQACDLGELSACTNLAVSSSGIRAVSRVNPRAVHVLKFSCDGALNVGCAGWGTPREVGSGSGDLPKARGLLKTTCDAGEMHACVNLGALLRYGLGGESDVKRAGELFRLACEHGNAGGCGEYGTLLLDGPDRNRSEGHAMLQRACDWGEKDSCAINAGYDTNSSSDSTTRAGVDALESLCENDHIAMACRDLGHVYFGGVGGKQKDPKRYAELIQRACEGEGLDRTSGYACVDLALAYLQGQGVKRNLDQGFRLLSQTCDRGEKDACSELAIWRLYGLGTTKDPDTAWKAQTELCEEGLNQACQALGHWFSDPRLGRQDDARALNYYTLACDLGDNWACIAVADFHLAGRGGLSRDPARARELYALECTSGFTPACEKAEKIR